METSRITKGKRVKHNISNWQGLVMAKRNNNVMVQWDHSGFTDKHNVQYLTIIEGKQMPVRKKANVTKLWRKVKKKG